ncbi:phosphate ABC transporter permease PstA [Methylococcus capsulatus]|uniref:phosphate ABC transporter permease PstA n=1 Tax=Methylococcus capsulatus TaxID=414 RepID=UPI001C5316FF|nr:phosphate ABC transporter permease PstA [Methylococcus capsulatus]QXP88190.1 phosphate ABC transporter permease PstA [Methylococcus capsulatus]QXP94801.1 phosphate ABC transporter permease PstA [Methylococcus capsulatus]UQN13225.1 phosphate ABC transporter permease PstA [Methylococcus capsulatus]
MNSEATHVLSRRTADIVKASLGRRHAAERRFRLYGLMSIGAGILMLVILLVSIFGQGYRAFSQTYVGLDVSFDPAVIDPDGGRSPEALASADYGALLKRALGELFPDVTERQDKRALYRLISAGASYAVRDEILAHPELVGHSARVWVAAGADVDLLEKGYFDRSAAEAERRMKDRELAWVDRLKAEGRLERRFNAKFFTAGDSRDPEQAGIGGALMGSFYTVLVTLVLSLPIGVAAAIYLEEFAPRNHWVDFIEVNINNLAAVPSIVFGLLGLAVFINFLGVPRSSPLVGGLVLTLMTLPVIIIAARSALKAVPPSIREAAMGVGASPMQTVFHHVVPLAMPGMLTGAIIGMSRALGESAPLLMIGMVAFIVDIPHGIFDPATVLPVQVYLWADSPERGFVERTSAAILVLLAFLILMNGTAVYLRRRFERRW